MLVVHVLDSGADKNLKMTNQIQLLRLIIETFQDEMMEKEKQ
jgi:hypothetical protein